MNARQPKAFLGGALIGVLGGLIGLGGAEFRLPLLIGLFHFAALEAVILNKAMSLVVVTAALPFRAASVPLAEVAGHWQVIANLLPGSLAGAGWALSLNRAALHRIIALLLLAIAALLLFSHDLAQPEQPAFTGPALAVAGATMGFGIGIVASLLGVAGGELLIPTLILLFAADIKLAGSLSLAVSLPTLLMGFARYSRDQSFAVLGRNRRFVLVMATGSLTGAFLGGRLLGWIPGNLLLPLLAFILVISAGKVWRHG